MEALDVLIAGLVGTGVGFLCVKFILAKWLDRIDSVPDKLSAINSHISAINVKLEIIDHLAGTLREHDRKIASLEAYYATAKAKRNTRQYREPS